MHPPRGILCVLVLLAVLCGCGPGSFTVQTAFGGGGTSSGTLIRLVLSPGSITLTPRGTAQFAVSGAYSDGSSRSVSAVTYSATGGTITADGLYTAGATPGAFLVIATQQGQTKADTSAVTVITSLPTALALVTQPAGAVSGAAFTQQPAVELRSALNQRVPQSGVVVTVSKASGTGTLAGTLTATTNAQGQALFAGLQITGTGAYTLAFTSPGLTKVTAR